MKRTKPFRGGSGAGRLVEKAGNRLVFLIYSGCSSIIMRIPCDGVNQGFGRRFFPW
jgi:hypothetical protein